jgi:hypothetical protein
MARAAVSDRSQAKTLRLQPFAPSWEPEATRSCLRSRLPGAGTGGAGGAGGRSAGGASNGGHGSLGQGGAGASLQPGGADGGGGGGGYYGGGGGGSGGTRGAGGGGRGSSYVDPRVTNPEEVIFIEGPTSGNGQVEVTFDAASEAVCLGQRATIVAMAGGVTRGTPGNDVIVARAAADRIYSGVVSHGRSCSQPHSSMPDLASAARPCRCGPAAIRAGEVVLGHRERLLDAQPGATGRRSPLAPASRDGHRRRGASPQREHRMQPR